MASVKGKSANGDPSRFQPTLWNAKLRNQAEAITRVLYVDPATVAAIAQAILAALEKGREKEAEEGFRRQILARLDMISEQLADIRRELALLAVKFELVVKQQSVDDAIGIQSSTLKAISNTWATAMSDRKLASALLFELDAKTQNLTRYGYATFDQVALSIFPLHLLNTKSNRVPKDKRALIESYSKFVKDALKEDILYTLAHQYKKIGDLRAELKRRADIFTTPTSTRLGTSDGGRYEYFEDVALAEDGYAFFSIRQIEHPEWRPPSHRDGPRDQRLSGKQHAAKLVTSAKFVSHANPVVFSEVILYTIEFTQSGTINLASPEDYAASYGHSGGDHWKTEHYDHITEHLATANRTVGLLHHIESSLQSLGESIHLANRLDAWLDSLLKNMPLC